MKAQTVWTLLEKQYNVGRPTSSTTTQDIRRRLDKYQYIMLQSV